MVAEKLDPTVGQICFFRNFQTVMNLEKRTTEMSSEVQKWWKRGMGRPEMAGKHKNQVTQGGGNRRVRRSDPRASDGGWP